MEQYCGNSEIGEMLDFYTYLDTHLSLRGL